MNIINFEKIINNENINDKLFIDFLKTNVKSDLDFKETSLRKLTEEEIDYEYVDISIIELLENLSLSENASACSCRECWEKNTLEQRFNKNMSLVYKIALYLLREGIHYNDLAQEGLIGLVKANNIYENDEEFDRYKSYYIAKEMIEYIKSYAEYRKIAFKKFIDDEKEKNIELNLNAKVLLKAGDEEKQEYEKMKKVEHNEEIRRLEKICKDLFEYSNLKYRLSLREIEILSLYFGLDTKERKNFTEIENIMKIDSSMLDKLLKEALYKLSVVNEKVEL